jgi:GDP-4-dehydro-6-deoxy-D-mannose reductase
MAHSILVTGATGFVGSHLLDRLADHTELAGWYRPDGRQPDRSRAIQWHPVDVLDAAAVRDSIDQVSPTRIYHLAGAPLVGASAATVVPQLRANALGTHHVLEAVRRLGLTCRVLVVSSAQIYQAGDEAISETAPLVPTSPYGLSKLAADQIALRAAEEDALDVVVARPFNHAGPRQGPDFVVSSFARQIALIEAGKLPPVIHVGNLSARRDLTDVRDVVDAYLRMMDSGQRGRPYNICSGRAWRVSDLLDELRHLSSVEVNVEVDQSLLRPIDAPVLQGDAARARAELGWTPRIPVERLLRDTLDWWRAEIRTSNPA